MKKLITFILLLQILLSFGQNRKSLNFKTINDFKKEFEILLKNTLTEEKFNILFDEYPLILAPYNEDNLKINIEGIDLKEYSLIDFKNENLYTENIEKLLNSENSINRKLSYVLIASTNDVLKENLLLDKLKTEKNRENFVWLGISLLSIKTSHTDELFDFIVQNENFGNAFMIPMYVKLNKNSIQQTAYKKIDSDNLKEKILAIQSLSVTRNNPKTEEIVKNAVLNWDENIKGYALYTLKELQIGGVLDLLKPLLENEKTRKLALESLANSPSKEDHDYLMSILNKDKSDKDVLNAYFNSKNIENLKIWLSIVSKNEIPSDYSFFVFEQPLLTSDDMLIFLHDALENSQNKEVLSELVRALKERSDEKSLQIMVNLLKHSSPTVRYWTAITLENNKSEYIQTKEVKRLIKKGLKEGNN